MLASTSSTRLPMLRAEIENLLDEALRRSFPILDEICEFVSTKGEALEKYGDDYQCANVVTVCNKLRAQDPYFFREIGIEGVAKVFMNSLSNSEMLQQVSFRGGCFVSFKLSWEWMAKRIQNMLDDGINTWAPINPRTRRAIVEFPTGDMYSNMHADVFRSQYMRDMLVRMYEYTGVDVSSTYANHHGLSHKRVFCESMVEQLFLVEQGEFKERGKHQPLFVGEAGVRGYINVDVDLGRLWSSIMEQHADFILYITPVRLRGYVEKCITAAKNVKWVDENKCVVACCAYQTSIDEKGKLACVLDEFRNYPEADSLVELVKAAGYTCTSESFFESALRYTYLKTPPRVDVTFSLDEMLDIKGNTLVYLLNTQALVRSIIMTPRRCTFKLRKVLVTKERELGLHIVRFTDVIEEACRMVSPHMVCEYLYKLCKKFKSCYNEVRPVEMRLLLCKATAVVMQKCLHLLCINMHCASPGRRGPLRRVEEFLSSKGEVDTVNCFIPWPVSVARPENPRFEMFSMFVSISPDFQEGNLFGYIDISDVYGLVPDGWTASFANGIGHVCYFTHQWCNSIRIDNNSTVWFGNPSSRHAVAFSSSIDIYVDLMITTQKEKNRTDACYEIYSRSKRKLSFWEEDKKSKCDILSCTSQDGLLRIHYILLRDAVDTTMEFMFESRVPNLNGFEVRGCVFAYYGDGVLDEKKSMHEFYQAIIFTTDGACVSAGEKLQLQRSVLSVPANGCLMITSFLEDLNSGEVIVDETRGYRAIPTGTSEWEMQGEKGTFYLKVNWSKGPGIIS